MPAVSLCSDSLSGCHRPTTPGPHHLTWTIPAGRGECLGVEHTEEAKGEWASVLNGLMRGSPCQPAESALVLVHRSVLSVLGRNFLPTTCPPIGTWYMYTQYYMYIVDLATSRTYYEIDLVATSSTGRRPENWRVHSSGRNSYRCTGNVLVLVGYSMVMLTHLRSTCRYLVQAHILATRSSRIR